MTAATTIMGPCFTFGTAGYHCYHTEHQQYTCIHVCTDVIHSSADAAAATRTATVRPLNYCRNSHIITLATVVSLPHYCPCRYRSFRHNSHCDMYNHQNQHYNQATTTTAVPTTTTSITNIQLIIIQQNLFLLFLKSCNHCHCCVVLALLLLQLPLLLLLLSLLWFCCCHCFSFANYCCCC